MADIILLPEEEPKMTQQMLGDKLFDEKVDEICGYIMDGWPFKKIATHFGFNNLVFFRWKAKTKFKQQVLDAIEASAHSFAQGALDVLIEHKDTTNMAQANIVKEIAQTMKFIAAKRNQAFYGTQKVDMTPVIIDNRVSNQEEFSDLLQALKEKKGVNSNPQSNIPKADYINFEEVKDEKDNGDKA